MVVWRPSFISVKGGRHAAALLLASALCGSQAIAQDSAGIIGQVTDESGAVLPGVTVTVTGPALQVPSDRRRHRHTGRLSIYPAADRHLHGASTR